MTYFIRRLLVLLAVIIILTPQNSLADTYYVSKDGSDDDSGRSAEKAWKTISKANEELKPGNSVFIMEGAYNETIAPVYTGEPGKYITYSRYNNDTVTITGVQTGAVLTHKSHIIIDGLSFVDQEHYWIKMRPATHCIIKRCHFNVAGAYQGIFMDKGANHNAFINNTLVGSGDGPNDLIWCFESHHNLFEGNDFQYGTHNGLDIQLGGYHVVRNNRFSNPYHTGLSFWSNADSNLVEHNTIVDCGVDYNKCDGTACSEDTMKKPRGESHLGIQLGASNNIIRNNVLVNNGAMGLDSYKNKVLSKNNRLYNNTFYDNYKGIISTPDAEMSNNIIKNNIFYMQREYELYMVLNPQTDRNNHIVNNAFFGNLIQYNKTTGNLQKIQRAFSEWHGNLNYDPQFVSVDNRDFRIKSTSPLRNKGTHLTWTVSDGSGQLLEVEDARYFSDGLGIIDGDTIQLSGTNATAKIIAIDYDRHLIELNRRLHWSEKTGVSIAYEENAPDIGAFEYMGDNIDTPAPAPPAGLVIVAAPY